MYYEIKQIIPCNRKTDAVFCVEKRGGVELLREPVILFQLVSRDGKDHIEAVVHEPELGLVPIDEEEDISFLGYEFDDQREDWEKAIEIYVRKKLRLKTTKKKK